MTMTDASIISAAAMVAVAIIESNWAAITIDITVTSNN